MAEVPKKKITLQGKKNAYKLYSFLKPYRVEYTWGMFFLGSSEDNYKGLPLLMLI